MSTRTPSDVSIPTVGDGSGVVPDERIWPEELQLALRNKAMPVEGLRYDVTPAGMHYTLIHFDIPSVDVRSWRLTVGGKVRRPLSLTLQELQQRPVQTLRVTLECAGDGRALLHPRPIGQPWLTGAIGTAEWTGTPLGRLLEEAGIEDGVREIVFTGLDHGIQGDVEHDYARSVSIENALHNDLLLAWAMNGAPLEPQHGYPLRLIVPGWYGMASVKWLGTIEAIPDHFDGYQQDVSYQYSQSVDECGEPVTLIRVRSLMIPPGFPDFLTRTRVVRQGAIQIEGRAWSGGAVITGVDVSADGGATWASAEVGESMGLYSWQSWRYVWTASRPGRYELCCRARDSAGNVQPVEQFWTAQGMGNNMAQRVPIVVL